MSEGVVEGMDLWKILCRLRTLKDLLAWRMDGPGVTERAGGVGEIDLTHV